MGWIPLIVVIVAIVWIVGLYNNLVAGRNRFKMRLRRSMCNSRVATT